MSETVGYHTYMDGMLFQCYLLLFTHLFIYTSTLALYHCLSIFEYLLYSLCRHIYTLYTYIVLSHLDP